VCGNVIFLLTVPHNTRIILCMTAQHTPSVLERLRLYRLEHDLSYRVLAKQMGMPESTVMALLTGRRGSQPTERTLFKIGRFLDEHEPQAVSA